MKNDLLAVAEPGVSGPVVTGTSQGHPVRKVFHLVDSLNVGGTETQAVELVRRLPPAGYEVTLGCLKMEGPLQERLVGSGVEVMEFHPKGGLDTPAGAALLARLSLFLRRGHFDVLHAHDLWSNLLGVTAARLAGVPGIVSSRRGDLAGFSWYQGSRRVWLRRVQNMGGVVLTNSTAARDALIREDGFKPDKLRVILNGVDTERFQGKSARSRLFPGVTGKVIVVVGNMHSDVKGHPWLIAAAPAIVREFPDTRFVFAGDGAARPQFERQVADLKLEANFLFLGLRSDVPDILSSADIGVLPSRSEGMPNAILEYMSAGLPVVASAVGGNRELVEEGVTGHLVPPEDSEALASTLLGLLRNPGAAARLGQNAREMIERKFSFGRLVREVDELYSELLASRGGKRR
jgi:L-malate glycosyltransferase